MCVLLDTIQQWPVAAAAATTNTIRESAGTKIGKTASRRAHVKLLSD